ncbi:hypothetical protein [Paenibacillus pini]|uniref:Uncharacterized protein n=1 Tax=Paenibacillus pini JCM 16418 TaxID=1236976 RepID=W7Z1J7_9BACL|nr:hypothetical protein [Paenibacillus pini]GAF10851.1 hypothetical protein JCM16418_5076 [Paenibacillus pini JCM 16418]
MTEDEYWANEPNDDNEILYEFLIDEDSDLTLLMLPKYEFDLENTLDSYYKEIKKCRNKDQIIQALRTFYSHIAGVVSLQDNIQYLQDRAKELEFNVQIMQEKYR